MRREPAARPEIVTEVTTLHVEGVSERSFDLDRAVAFLRAQARKKGVSRVTATLTICDGLSLTVEVLERGARLQVKGRGLYAASVDGLLNAIADVIRDEHASDAALLDVYGRLLQG